MHPRIPNYVKDRRLWLLPLILWASLVFVSLHDHLDDLHQQSVSVATEGARNMFRMIVLTRAWNAEHGGVYVPVGEKVQPNPYLEHPRRVITATDGGQLTLVNPAFMTRLISEMAEAQTGTAFHITSLRPIRPGNAPDDWERRALELFESGRKEIDEVVGEPPQQRLRYMAPLLVAKPCLTCHAKQGYKLGDVRGGISVSIPFAPVAEATVPARRQSIATHLGTFLLVAILGGILLEALRRRWLALTETISDLDATRKKLENSNADLEQARLASDAASLAKSSFLANMSHEIRTPMNAIIGMAHLTLKTELSPGQRNYLQKIHGASQHLLGVINDILDYSKIEAGKLVIEHREFNLDELFDNVASLLGEKVASKELELVIDIAPDVPHMLVGDSLRLQQVLLNLGSNAVKFTETGEINVAVHRVAAERGEAVLEFDVRDTGIGIDPAALKRLFNSFEQADNSVTRKYGGSGLGLAISKRMVELMGGRISVVSSPGAGSTFSFTARFGLAAKPIPRRQPNPDLRGRRILVVDDNASAREVIGALLHSMSFSADVCDSGSAALRLVEAAATAGNAYDVVLIDWQMPEMDGVATAQGIARLGLARQPKMVMITAYGRDDLADTARKAGFVEVIGKPVTASTLFDALMTAMSGSQEPHADKRDRQGEFAQDVGLSGKQVLLVEDNELNQEVARDLLCEYGLEVDVAGNGAIALDMLRAKPYDLVLMDVQMPVMDGLTATREIRRRPALANLPVIAMTANAMSTDREICLEAGMNDHMAKPIDPDQLLATLRRWAGSGDAAAETVRAVPSDSSDEGRAVTAMRDVPGLDVSNGLRLARGREKLYLSLLARYVSNQRDFSAYLDAAMETGDWQTAVRLAHTLKGISGQIGAQTVRGLAELLENALQRREANGVTTTLKGQIADALGSLIAAIDARLPRTAPSEVAVQYDRQKLTEVCSGLLAQLASGNFVAVQLLDAHEPLLRAAFGSSFDEIQAAVRDFDYEKGLARLQAALRRAGEDLT